MASSPVENKPIADYNFFNLFKNSPLPKANGQWGEGPNIAGVKNLYTTAKQPVLSDSLGGYGGGHNAPGLENINASTDGYGNPITGVAGPDAAGSWMDWGGMAIGAAKVGVGAWQAYNQMKMVDYMEDYYGDQMAIAKADFTNNARSANEALYSREQRILDARGGAPIGSDANKAGVADKMEKWGVDENI